MHMHLDSDHSHEHHHADHRAGLSWAVGWLVLLAVCGVLVARTLFFVDETEYVYVTQFGQPLRLYTEAGLGVKWPYQSLWRFDRRLQICEPPAREMLTEDKENLNFGWFVCWRLPGRAFIAEPAAAGAAAAPEDIETYVRRFLQAVGSVSTAESRLEERIQAALAAEIGRVRMDQIVSLQADRSALDDISRRVTDALRRIAAEQFGIEVVDVRISRFTYPEAVKPAVYAEIRSERERVAVQYRSEGASQKAQLESLADLQREQLLAQARREAATIRGEGEAKAMEIFNAAHQKSPEFYQLLKTLETYRSILDEQTTLVLSADSPLLKLLTRGLPEPAEKPEP
jgi:membrane protease subunit HflC